MANYDKSTGTSGTLRISLSGNTLKLQIICSNSATFASGKTWSGKVNGSNVGGTFSISGVQTVTLGTWTISTNQTVQLNMGATGTSGLAGPTNHSKAFTFASAPDKITDFSLDNVTQSSFRINWIAPDNNGSAITRYESQIADDSGFTVNVGPLINNALSLNRTETGLAARRTYYMRVRAVNAIGTGPWSDVLVLGTTDYPDAPILVLGSKTSTTINTTLTDPGYVGLGVLARETQLAQSALFTTVLATDTTTTPVFTGRVRATKYFMRSRIQDSVGWGPWSSVLEVTTDADVPSTPTGYVSHDVASRSAMSTLGSILDNGGFALTQVNYQINTSANPTGATDVTLDSAREPLFLGLTQGVQYYYRLRVYNGQFWSGWGAWQTFTTVTNVPNQPTSLAVNSVDDDSVVLTWVAPSTLNGSTISGYKVMIGSNKAQNVGYQEQTVAGLSAAFVGLNSLTNYWARVYAITNNGNGTSTDLLMFTTTGSGSLSPFWLQVAGVWKQPVWWMNVAGVWKQITWWMNVLTVWKNH